MQTLRWGHKPLVKQLITCLVMLAVLCGLLWAVSPVPAGAAEKSILITGDGVETPVTLTLEELQAMTQVRQVFSANNTYPTKKFYVGEGVKLSDILAKAGIKDEAQILTFYATDGLNITFTKQYLLEGERYYFPGLQQNSEEGKTVVEPIIALLSYGGTSFDHMDGAETPRLFYGQRVLSEQNAFGYNKYIYKIEVSTAAVEQCAPPTADVASGVVNPGTKVNLSSGEQRAKIYYTTDGSTPDLNSPIFNLSDFVLNPPLDITGNTTIKAFAYNFSKLPSDIATFTYTVDEGSTVPSITLTKPWGDIYYPGDTVAINGTARNLETVDVTVSAPNGETVYTANALAVSDDQFSTNFTLAADAALGNYTVSVSGEGLSEPVTTSCTVKEDSSSIGGPNTGVPDQIVTSWSADPAGTRVISWRIQSGSGQTQLQCVPAAGFNGTFTGWTFNGNVTDLYDGHSRVEVHLSNLNPGSGPGVTLPPGTPLVYHVGCDGAWSEPAVFTTAPADDQTPFTFFYMGDVQEGYIQWGKMFKDAYAAHPNAAFTLLGGDLVNDGNSSDDWSKFFASAMPTAQQIGLFPAAGNHDSTDLFYRSFALPGNGPVGDLNKKFYSFNYGNAHFAVLDSMLMGTEGADYEAVTAWLKEDLNNCGKVWKFVMFHHPPYPVRAAGDAHAPGLRQKWVPIFEECGVDVAFVGHQHAYMRTHPLRENSVQSDGEGIVYIMGNAGSKYYPADGEFDYIAQKADNVSTYQVIDIDGLNFTLTSKNAAGEVIDSYTFKKEVSLNITSPAPSGDFYLPGEYISIRGTARNVNEFTARLLDAEGNELSKKVLNVNADGTITRSFRTLRNYAPGEYTLEIAAEGLETPYIAGIKLEPMLRIYGDGVNSSCTVTYAELQAMAQQSVNYSLKSDGDNYAPVPAEGVKLSELLVKAGLKDEAQLIRFQKVNDYDSKFSPTFTKAELLEQPRYYYPNLAEGSAEGAAAVDTLLTLRSGGGMSPSNINELQDNRYWFNLMLGQRAVGDENHWRGTISGIKGIEVLTEAPQQSAVPIPYPPSLPVPAGTQVAFDHLANSNSANYLSIYYTTDGSDPSFASHLNYGRIGPVIEEDTTVKAIAYVTGQLPSEVITLSYTVNGEPNEEPVIYIPIAGQVYQPGDKIMFMGYSDWNLTLDVTGPDGERVYSEIAQNRHASYNVWEFTLPEDATEGKYTVKMTGGSLSNTRTFQVQKGGSTFPGVILTVPTSGQVYNPGQAVTVSGSAQNLASVNISITGPDAQVVHTANDVAVSDGLFSSTFTLAADAAVGSYTISISGEGLTTPVTGTFTVAEQTQQPKDFVISSVKLLNTAGNPISSVSKQGGYRIEAVVDNNTAAAQQALVIIQVRNGSNATATQGGHILDCIGVQTTVLPTTAEEKTGISADFTLPAGLSGQSYVDVFIWDGWSQQQPLGDAHQTLNFAIAQ